MNLSLPATSLLSTCCLLTVAHAQTTVHLGPRVGYNAASAAYNEPTYGSAGTTSARSGVEAGVLAVISRHHLSVQPALLYSQKGFALSRTVSYFLGGSFAYTNDTHVRLTYLTLPLNVAYTQRATGEGVQVFAGPYVGLLLGGTYTYSAVRTSNGVAATQQGEGDVEASDHYASTDPTDARIYSRRFDAGLQVGAGYRLGGTLLQVSYSVGLRNVNADYQGYQVSTSAPTYENRAFQVGLTYLVGSSH